MGYIAKGTITLDTVNDAYTVSLTKSSCVIHADFDGSNPQLDDAWTQITVCRGDKRMAFDCTKIEEANRPEVKITTDNRTSYIVRLTSVPTNSLEGSVGLHIHTDDGWNTDIRLAYTIVRESSMLDWIKDWEGGKTKIGGTYIMTPKLFIGKKENFADYAEGGSSPQSDIMAVPRLTGVYIGPDASSTGLYGYSNSKEIFHLNDKGGMIGGWTITETGLTSRNGLLQILGDGAIKASNDKGDTMWEISQDGAASFAKGNVNFYANGNADFKGKITSTEGSIGGWSITQNQIWKGNLGLDCRENAIGVAKANIVLNAITNESCLLSSVKNAGGVAIFYGSETNWGLIGYKSSFVGRPTCVFELGAANSIAGWSFDQSALWSGTKNDTVGTYTTDGITLGSNGIRGNKWYIDTNGDVSFMGGLITFSAANNGGEIVGWKLNAKRLSNPNVAIVSDTANAGIFMSVANGTDFNNFASSSLTDYIDAHGGIYMKIKTDGVSFAAYDKDGYKIFKLRSNGVSSIASWNIENDALFVGSKKVDAGSFTDAAGSMTFSSTGIRGNKWRLEADGSGSLAGDMISWNAAGEVDFKAKVSADNITAGIISACTIQSSANSPTWKLNPDGSGYLANENITWKSDGNLKIQGEIEAISGKIGGFDIHYNSIGLESYDNQGYGNNGMYLGENMICFNSGKRQAILGCWNNLGLPVICRMTDQTDDYTAKVGLAIKITGSTDVNTAIEMGGGWLSGLNYKVQSEGFDKITAQKIDTPVPKELNVTLSRSVVCLHASTQFYWRSYANRNNDKKFETKARDVNVTLPEMKHYDNGHVLMIKRGINNDKDVYLIPGKSYQKHLNANGTSYETEGNTCILIDNNTYVTDKLILDSEGDAMQLIYFRDLSVTIDNVKYNGVWVQWKNPRAW